VNEAPPEAAARDPYAGADLTNARRMTALLAVMSAILAVAFLPLSPPVEPSKGAGWAGLALLIAATLVSAGVTANPRRHVGFGHLLAVSYLGVVFVAAAVWITGGYGSVYGGLYLLAIASGVGVHPPRRAIPMLVMLMAASALPLAYEGWHRDEAKVIAGNVLLWIFLATGVMVLMVRVRAQRVEMAERESRQAHLAREDSLTGLGNRRAFEEALRVEGARSRRAGSTLSLVVIDVDDFKNINDTFGHDAGDKVLCKVADTLRMECRASDRAFRWGGDEFVVLLPDTDLPHAQSACGRISRAVADSCEAPNGSPLQVSCGASVLTGDGEDRLLAEADAALYGGKHERSGLDRV
jgi:diguanylate cyclase (GGDEF)-like protein